MWVARRGLLALCACATGCGRIGFGLESGGAGGDATADVSADAAPCVGAAAQLAMDDAGSGTWVTALRAARTTDGFTVTYIAPDQVAFALAYSVTGGTGAPIVADTTVEPSSAVHVGSAALGSIILVVSEAGTATSVRPYNRMLSMTSAGLTRPTRHALDRSLVGTEDNGTVALFTSGANTQIGGTIVTPLGADTGSLVPMITASGISAEQIVAGAGGFVGVWLEVGTVRAATFDLSLATVTAPTSITSGVTAFEPSVGWASAQHRGLVAWQEQGGAARAVIVDQTLAPIGAPFTLAASGNGFRIASDGNSFWVVWHDTSQPTRVGGAHVTADARVTPFSLAGTGGMEVDHDVVRLTDGTVQVIWFERGGIGEPLWVIPACTLGT
jgi:hypothetical protein